MKTLKNIEVTPQELQKMRKMSKAGGSEADILFIKDTNGKAIARKVFKKNMGCFFKTTEEQEQMRENKKVKITTLANLKTFNNEVKVLRTLSCNGQFVGYDMTRNPKAFALYQVDLPSSILMTYMNQVKNKLQEFHEQGIVYGDINNANILVDLKKRSASFCDLDNMQVGELPIDFLTVEVVPFLKKGLVPETVDSYTLNFTILETMTGLPYGQILYQLKKGWVPKCISRQGRQVLQKMSGAAKKRQYDGDYLMPYVKKR